MILALLMMLLTAFGSPTPLYRYYNDGNNDHFYTTNIKEIGTGKNGQVGRHGYKSEGVAGYCSPRPGRGLRPLYRFLHLSSRGTDHFYKCSSRHTPGGYRYEGIACYVPA